MNHTQTIRLTVAVLCIFLLCIGTSGCTGNEQTASTVDRIATENEQSDMTTLGNSTEDEKTEPTEQLEDARSALVSSSLVEYDCDLLSISLPERLTMLQEGRYFENEEAMVCVSIKPISKFSMRTSDATQFAQMLLGSADLNSDIQYNEEAQSLAFSYNGYAYIGDSYIYATNISYIYETEDIFLKVDFACSKKEIEFYRPYFAQWSASICINDVPTGSIYHGRNEVEWSVDELCLLTDPAFVQYNLDSYDLYLADHYGNEILVWKRSKLTEPSDSLLDYYETLSLSESELEILPRCAIAYYNQNGPESEEYSSKSYTVLMETDHYWYFVGFMIPQNRYAELFPKIKAIVDHIKIVEPHDIGVNWSKPEMAAINAYKNIFGSTPERAVPIYQDDNISIVIAKQNDEKNFLFVAQMNERWEAKQLFHYRTEAIVVDGEYVGDVYSIGGLTVLICKEDAAVPKISGAKIIELPEYGMKCIIYSAGNDATT